MKEPLDKVLNRLAKWRSVLTGWQLGTRASDDPEAQAVRDHREATMMTRVEVTALSALLLRKGVFTEAEFEDQIREEASWLMRQYEQKFPGAEAVDEGMKFDAERVKAWMSKFPR